MTQRNYDKYTLMKKCYNLSVPFWKLFSGSVYSGKVFHCWRSCSFSILLPHSDSIMNCHVMIFTKLNGRWQNWKLMTIAIRGESRPHFFLLSKYLCFVWLYVPASLRMKSERSSQFADGVWNCRRVHIR